MAAIAAIWLAGLIALGGAQVEVRKEFRVLRRDNDDSLGKIDPEYVSFTAAEMARNICESYAFVPRGFCDRMVQSFANVQTARDLFGVPMYLSSLLRERYLFLTPRLEPSHVFGALDLRPFNETAGLAASRDADLPLEDLGALVASVVADSPNNSPALTLGAYLDWLQPGEGQGSAFDTIRQQVEDLIQDRVERQVWAPIAASVEELRIRLSRLRVAVSVADSKIPRLIRDLASFAVGKEELFKVRGSGVSLYPLYSAWAQVLLPLYRCWLCHSAYLGLPESDQEMLMGAMQGLAEDFVTYSAATEATHAVWFLSNRQYTRGAEVALHYQLQFGYDFAWLLSLLLQGGDACQFPRDQVGRGSPGLSAFALYDRLTDNPGELRAPRVEAFFAASFNRDVPQRTLEVFGRKRRTAEGLQRIVAMELRYDNGDAVQYGDMRHTDRMDHYHLGGDGIKQDVWQSFVLWDSDTHERTVRCEDANLVQHYTQKEAFNRFEVRAFSPCDGSIATRVFGGLPVRPTWMWHSHGNRIINGFIGVNARVLWQWAHLQQCAWPQQRGVWNVPGAWDSVLDLALVTFQSDYTRWWNPFRC